MLKISGQVVLVYLQPFQSNLLLKCASQPDIAKKFTKTSYFEGSKIVQDH